MVRGGEAVRALIEALLQKQQWQSCLDAAEIALSQNPPDRDQAFLLYACCRCHFSLGAYFKGASCGDIAGFLARRIGQWDLSGEAIYRAGLCFYYGKAYDQALTHLESYFTHEPNYVTAQAFKGEVLFIQGCARRTLRQHRAAAERFERAVEWAESNADEADVELYRLNLIWSLLESEQLDKAEEMLGHLQSYVDRNPEEQTPRLHLLHDQAHLLFLRKQFAEAYSQAILTIEESLEKDLLVAGQVLLTLHHLARQLGKTQEAIHLSLALKRLAVRTKSPTLEERINHSLKELHRQVGTPTFLEAMAGVSPLRPRRAGRTGGQRRRAAGGAG